MRCARRRRTPRSRRSTPTPHPPGSTPPVWQEWCDRFQQHLARHGHTVYNLDFAVPVPADDPAPLLGTLRFYLDGGGTDPAQRQQRAAQRREEATAQVARPAGPACAGRRSAGCCAGRRRWRRCAKTPSPTSGSPGRSCAGCCRELGAPAGRPRASWNGRTTCSGCTARRSSRDPPVPRAERRGAAPGAVAGAAAGRHRRRCCRRAAGGRGRSPAGCPRRRTSRPAPCCAGSAPAPGRSPPRPGCSAARPTSAACSRATCWSPASPPRPGRRCSRWRRRS